MFRKTKTNTTPANTPKPQTRKEIPSVISTDFNLLGNIICDGIIDFDGKIDGNIQCVSIIVRKHATVNGEIKADSVQVYGKVKGLIRAKNVSLFSSCVVEGIVMHETISIADGAVIDGKMKRIDKSAPKAAAANFDIYDENEDDNSGTPLRMLEGFKLITSN